MTKTKISKNEYDQADHGSALGRLSRTTSYDDDEHVVAQMDYYYTAAGGRLDHQDTVFDAWDGAWGNIGNGPIYSTKYTYDSLGNIASVKYPTTDLSSSTASTFLSFPARRGLTRSIHWETGGMDLVSRVLYSYAGGVKEWDGGNGLRTVFIPDDTILSRVKEVQVQSASYEPLWRTGLYAYDGAGQIKGIDSDKFIYDEVGRVVEARIVGPTGTAIYEDKYTYDVFGNITLKKHQEVGNDPAPDMSVGIASSTNRITAINGGNAWEYWSNGALKHDDVQGLYSHLVHDYAYDNAGRLEIVKIPTVGGPSLEVGSYKYDASATRIVRKENHGKEEFTFRDVNGAVLSKFSRPEGSGLAPTWDRDFVYLNGGLVAMIEETVPATVSWQLTRSDGTGNTLQWWPNSGTAVYGYLVLRKAPGDNNFVGLFVEASSITTSGTSYLDTGTGLPGNHLTAGSTYIYKVVAVSQNGTRGPDSSEKQIIAGDTVPPPPLSGVTAVPGNAKVTISWSQPAGAPQSDLGGYYVYRKISGSYGNPLNAYPIPGTQYVDLSVVNGTTYTYSVRMADTSGNRSGDSNQPTAKPSSKLSDNLIPKETIDFHLASGALLEGDLAPYSVTGQLSLFNVKYLHSDHLGSVRVVSNWAGTFDSTHKYYAYGEEIGSPVSNNPFRYAGYERDPESGMDYVLARYYSSSVGRFASADPAPPNVQQSTSPVEFEGRITDSQIWNRYTYVRNNPLYYRDPNGQFAQVAVLPAYFIPGAGQILLGATIGTAIGIGIFEGVEIYINYRKNKEIFKYIEGKYRSGLDNLGRHPQMDPNDPWGRWQKAIAEMERIIQEIKDAAEKLKNDAKKAAADEMARDLQTRLDAARRVPFASPLEHEVDRERPGFLPTKATVTVHCDCSTCC